MMGYLNVTIWCLFHQTNKSARMPRHIFFTNTVCKSFFAIFIDNTSHIFKYLNIFISKPFFTITTEPYGLRNLNKMNFLFWENWFWKSLECFLFVFNHMQPSGLVSTLTILPFYRSNSNLLQRVYIYWREEPHWIRCHEMGGQDKILTFKRASIQVARFYALHTYFSSTILVVTHP